MSPSRISPSFVPLIGPLILTLVVVPFLPNPHPTVVSANLFSYSSDNYYFEKYGNAYLTYSECDRIFVSSSLNATHGTRNGTFIGPDLAALGRSELYLSETGNGSTTSTTTTTVAPTTEATNADGAVTKPEVKHARQCIYTFIAGENERVRVGFLKFGLRSEAPECLEEYIDVYSELEDPGSDLLNSPFGGRYCDRVIPQARVSLYRTIVFSFYTELNTAIIGENVFRGEYEFINAEPFVAGTPIPNEVCSFAINSEQRREGEIMSPTYPGVYPKGVNCFYLFKGVKGQRVKIEFMDFDLFYGGAHCPFDYMKIYDGESDEAPLINTYCGQQRQLMVFSSGTSLFVQFSTKRRIADTQNRGFTGYFEFSEKFVNLGFITNNNNSEHIRGSECDQKILSRHGSNGTVYAPNYPFLYHSNTMCRYYFYGLQDAQNLEKINFEFEMLQIPTKDINECTDAYVRLYTQTQAVDEFDYAFCGETLPQRVVSDGPILMVIFNSGSTQGQGFKARYWFETDYKIPGAQPTPGRCHFRYLSTNGEKSGDFNSPRHPANYPSSTNCVYEFVAEPGERILLVFSHFKVSDQIVTEQAIAGYNDVCQQDWVEIYAGDNETLYGRYCAMTAPGPIITEPGVTRMKVVMNTDATHVSGGFSAHFRFLRSGVDPLIHCGSNYTNLENGVIKSPNYPEKYPDKRQLCNWFITVRPGHRILLYLEQFLVEGDPAGRGCSAAVVRVWSNPASSSILPLELCGDSLANKSKEIISTDNFLRLSFFGAQKSVGATGFSAVWTEIAVPIDPLTSNPILTLNNQSSMSSSLGVCPENVGFKSHKQAPTSTGSGVEVIVQLPQFQCAINKFCISSQLRCNGIANCGFGDNSDEANCVKQVKLSIIDLLGGFTGLAMLILFTVGVLGLTLILLVSWYRRLIGCGPKQVQDSPDDKNGSCPHLLYNLHQPTQAPMNGHFAADPISGLVMPFESGFNPSDTSDMSPPSQHRVLTLSMGGKSSKWAAAGSSSDAARMLLEDDGTRCGGSNDRPQSPSTDDTPIPPPPPPPHSSHHLQHQPHPSHHNLQSAHLVQSRSNHSSLEHSLHFNTIAPEPSIMMMMNVAGSSQSIDRFSSFRPPAAGLGPSVFNGGPPPPPPLSTFAFANSNVPMFHTLPHQFHHQQQPSGLSETHPHQHPHPAHHHQFGGGGGGGETHFATLQRYNPKNLHKGSSIDVATYHSSGPEVLEDDDAELSLRLGTSTSSGISHHLHYKLANNANSGGGVGTDSLFNSNDPIGAGSSGDENGIDAIPMLGRHCSTHENQSLTMDE